VPPASSLDLSARDLAQKLRVSTSRKSYYVEVSYADPDPDRAALVANAVASEYILLTRRAHIARRYSQLETQLHEAVAKYNSSHPRVQAMQAEFGQAQNELKQLSSPDSQILSPEALAETGLVIPALAVSIPTNIDLVSIIAFGLLLALVFAAIVVCFVPTTRNFLLRNL
jgi:hypothetical protein